MDDATIEKEVIAKGLTAPRTTLDDLNRNIKTIEIVKHTTAVGQVLRWAVITTISGFAVTGKPSCAVSHENDDEELGSEIAVDNARNEMWALMSYHLACKIAEA